MGSRISASLRPGLAAVNRQPGAANLPLAGGH
jgi:hypothetical protein